jgi:hypothetical protein
MKELNINSGMINCGRPEQVYEHIYPAAWVGAIGKERFSESY